MAGSLVSIVCALLYFANVFRKGARKEERGRREVTGHGQMRVKSEENGGMIEEQDMAVVTDGRGEGRLVEGSVTDRSEGWMGEGGIDTQPHSL